MPSRWTVLALCSFIVFGNYYAYDLPAAFNLQLEPYLQTSNYQYYLQAFYSVYSIPNIVLPFFGGMITDYVGIPKMLTTLALLVTLGQIVFTIGLSFKSTAVMLLGRLLLGLGSETLGVVQSQITATWFLNKELALASGLNICIGRLGSVLNDILTPWITTRIGILAASWAASLFCFMSYTLAVILAQINNKVTPSSPTKPTFILNFSTGFYLICTLIVILEGVMIPFNTIHAELLSVKYYPNQPLLASQAISLPDTFSAILIPFVGYTIDKVGYRSQALLICCIILSIIHTTFYFTPSSANYSPLPLLFILGVAYSLIVTVWSTIPLLTTNLALGYGITTSASNLSLTIMPLIVAYFVDKDKSFGMVELWFIINCLVGVGVCLYLDYWDKRNGRNLRAVRMVKVEESYDELGLEEFDEMDGFDEDEIEELIGKLHKN